MISRIIVILCMLALSVDCLAQNTDSTSKVKKDTLNFPKRVVAVVTDNFAIIRPLNFEFSNTSPYNFKPEHGNGSLPESRVTKFQQMKVSANFNFIKRKSWLLGATVGYRGTSVEAEIMQPEQPEKTIFKDDFHYLFSGLSFSYFSTLFKKPAFYSSTILLDGSDKHFERVKGMFTATMLLKANQRTRMTVGFVINIDPASQIPAIPTFTYEHKFNNGWIADVVLPRSMYLRKFVFRKNGRFSVGMEMDQTLLYMYNLEGTNQKYEYRQLDINPGVVYEHALGKHFIFTAKSGAKLTNNGRVFRKESSFEDHIYEMKPDPSFYFNVGVSFNPLSLFGKKR
ncbi:hypothetical protein [Pedobacter caeni]|nr:hypothetical protein [Pedobacter caeni]